MAASERDYYLVSFVGLQLQQGLHRIFTEQQQFGILQQFLHAYQEAYRLTTVDDAVVVAQCQVHHGLDHYLTIDCHRTLLDLVHAEDRTLRQVDDGGAHQRTKHTTIGDGERTALQLFHGQLVVSCFTSQLDHLLFDTGHAEAFYVADHRYGKTAGRRNGDGDI